jgi:oxygen-dependent protoporphyrinogen oxidase
MKVLVLGAGFSGMGAAQRLREAGVDVSVLEGSHRAGGRAHTMEVRAVGSVHEDPAI